MDKYSLYVLIFPDNKKYYGITKQNIKDRWQNGNGYKNQPVYEVIKKFGWENIEHKVIFDNLTSEEASILEDEYIKKDDTINNGYNCSKGGSLGSIPWSKIYYNEKIYSSKELLELSNVENLTEHDLTTRINCHNWDVDRALTQSKIIKNRQVKYNNNLYTLQELLKFSNIKDLTVDILYNRLFNHNWDIDRALSQPTNVKIQPFGTGDKIYEYNGKLYNSYELCQISKLDNLTPTDITTRINHHKWSVEKAITQPKKSRNKLYEYKGSYYTSSELADMAIDKRIKKYNITDRLRSGWSIEKALNTPLSSN